MSRFQPTYIDLTDAFERILWTAVEAFLSVITVEAIFFDGTDVIQAAVIAGGAAALTAIKVLVQQRLAELE